MKSQTLSIFDKLWQTPKSSLQYIKAQVYNHFDNPNRNKQQVFKLKKSILSDYTFVYNLCISKPSYKQMVFDKYKQSLKEFLTQPSRKRKTAQQQNDKDKFRKNLARFNDIWESFAIFMLTISKRVFSYLDRYFTPAMDEGTLSRIGLNIFVAEALDNVKRSYIFSQYINQLGRMRQTRIICHKQLLKFSQSLMVLDPQNLFTIALQVYLTETKSFYSHFYSENQNLKPYEFLNAANNLLHFQKLLVKYVIKMGHRQQLIIHQLFELGVIAPYTQKLLIDKQGLIYFLNNKKIEAMKKIINIYSQFQGFEKIRKVVYDYTLQKGQQFLNSKSKSNQGIDQFYSFYMEFSNLIAQGFEKQKDIEISFKNGIQKISSNYQSLAYDLLQYTREILDKGMFDQHKQKIKVLFQLLPSKDDFLTLYQSSVEKKILDGSFIYLIQKRFVNQMNDLCGSTATTRIDKKIQDYVHSLPICTKYNQQSQTNILFNSKVLSFQLWQKKFDEQITLNINLVKQIAPLWTEFQNLYLQEKQFQNRKLMLLPFQSKFVLNLRFNYMELRVKCNLLQACIIFFLANLNKTQSNQEFNVKEQDIIFNLMIQKQILNKFMQHAPPFIKQKQNQIGVYYIDWNYSGKQIFIDLDKKATEDRKIPKTAIQDRDILLQAAIMKSMKKAKEATFQQIVEQVLLRIKLFKPQPVNIKASIQKLIKKEMLQQDQTGLYKYIE